MTASTVGQVASSATPFGPDVFVFAPGMSSDVMQAQIDKIYAEQQFAEFGASRYAFLLLPGDYKLNVPIGFYTQVLGVGNGPDSVHIEGDVRVDASRSMPFITMARQSRSTLTTRQWMYGAFITRRLFTRRTRSCLSANLR